MLCWTHIRSSSSVMLREPSYVRKSQTLQHTEDSSRRVMLHWRLRSRVSSASAHINRCMPVLLHQRHPILKLQEL